MRHVAWLSIVAAAAIYVGVPTEASGDAPGQRRVAVGELGPTAAPLLSDALEAELRGLDGVYVTQQSRARYVVQGSITQLDRVRLGRSHEVRCRVSLMIVDASGSVRLLLNGSAGARGGSPEQLERAAVNAAVRGALSPLPRSLARL